MSDGREPSRALTPGEGHLSRASVVKRGVKLAESLRFADWFRKVETGATAALVKRGIELGEHLLVTDRLTGLYNKLYLVMCVRKESKRAWRSGRPLSLMFIDLDDFKNLSKAPDDGLAERLLVEAADIVRSSAFQTHVVAHLSDGGFAILLAEADRQVAFAVGERVRQRLESHVFLASRRLKIHLTASIGIATLPEAAATADELVEAADQAMLEVKASGGNALRVAIPRGRDE